MIEQEDKNMNQGGIPNCKDCGAQLKFFQEIESGHLCNLCQPGSMKHQKDASKNVATISEAAHSSNGNGSITDGQIKNLLELVNMLKEKYAELHMAVETSLTMKDSKSESELRKLMERHHEELKR